MGFRSGLPQPHSSIYLISLWLSILKRPSRVPGAACRAGTIATPQKSGGACGPKKRCGVTHLFSALMTGRYRPHSSLREGLEQTPFPLALHRVGSVLAVKGSLRRFAPWTAPGRSERRAAYEGKGGGGPRAGRTLYPVASDLTSSPSNRGVSSRAVRSRSCAVSGPRNRSRSSAIRLRSMLA